MKMFRWALLSATMAIPGFAFAGSTDGMAQASPPACCDQHGCCDGCEGCPTCDGCDVSCEACDGCEGCADCADCDECTADGAACGTEEAQAPAPAVP